MFCVNCGEKLNEGEMVCHKCGASQVPATGESPIDNQVNNNVQSVNNVMNNPEPAQNMVNQPVNNMPVNNAPVNNGVAPQGNNGGNKWLVPVLIVIIVVLAIVVIFFLLDKNNSGNSGVGGRDVQTTTTPGGGSTVAVEDTIDYSGYKFKKVAGYSYQIDDGAFESREPGYRMTIFFINSVCCCSRTSTFSLVVTKRISPAPLCPCFSYNSIKLSQLPLVVPSKTISSKYCFINRTL